MNKMMTGKWWLASLAVVAAGCSQPKSTTLSTLDAANGLGSAPTSAATKFDLLRRYRGQDEFLTAGYFNWRRGGPVATESASRTADKGGGRRAIQEADLFKIGDEGKKLLFLLNSARGLQVVSFAKGADQPELLSRVAPTGNYPSQMYYDSSNKRLVVLENVYSENWYESRNQSRLVSYDVSNPQKPAIKQALDIEGQIAESRLVGDVLYLATSIQPVGRDSMEKPQGRLTSVAFNGAGLTTVATYDLALPVAYGELMNIAEVENNGKYQYYLVAVQSETGWGWGDRQSMVEVVDISSEQGAIAPIMQISAKGVVRERSQTFIRNNTLIVTSNFTPAGVADAKMQIAVEAFTFPTAQSSKITEREAQFRKLYIERELSQVAEANREVKEKELLADSKLGLKGVFVQSDKGLRKLFADSVKTSRDDEGQHAQLQDVRYQDGLLYAFWVPRNQIDPLDIFDISQPEKEIKYVSRLKFEGWIERAEPMKFNGKNYILGLGWKVPAVDNERGLRRPQAMIFEIKNTPRGIRAEDVAQLDLDQTSIWTHFNAGDKYVDVRETADGKGEILFSAVRYEPGVWEDGGKIINFNLAEINSGKALTNGPFLSGNKSWIRRVFKNPEIDRVAMFATEELSVFNTKSAGAGIATATATLELARNIRAYETLPLMNGVLGAQIVSRGDMWYSEKSETQIRFIDHATPDAEKAQVWKTETLPGAYVAHVRQGNALLVLTSVYKVIDSRPGSWQTKIEYHLSKVTVAGSPARLVSQVTEKVWERLNRSGEAMISVDDSKSFVGLSANELLVQTEGEIRRLTNGDLATLQLLKMDESCKSTEKSETRTLKRIGDQMVIQVNQSIEDKEFATTYTKNFFGLVNLNGANLNCQALINIPGEVEALATDGSVLVSDRWAKDIVSSKGEREPTTGSVTFTIQTEEGLSSLKLKAKKAVLKDQLAETLGYRKITVAADEILVIKQTEAVDNGWGPIFPMEARSSIWRPSRRQTMGAIEFMYIKTEDGLITADKFSTRIDVGSYAELAMVTQAGALGRDATNTFAVLSGSKGLQLVEFGKNMRRPEVRQLKMVQADGQEDAAADLINLRSGYSWYGNTFHITPETSSLEIARGLSGVSQAKIVK